MKMIYIILLALSLIALVSNITKAELDSISEYEGDIPVIIQLHEEPIVPSQKRLSQEPPYDSKIVELFANFTGTYDKDNKFNKHKKKLEKEHKDIKNKLDKTYNVKKIKREYQHLLNGLAFNVSNEQYQFLLDDTDIQNVWIDLVVTETATNIHMNDSIAEIKADDLWSITDNNGNNITGLGVEVAVIDGGIMYNHTDFGNCSYTNVTTGKCNKISYMYDFANDDDDAYDDNGHGTHCSGTIAANVNMKGVAPNATLVAYKVLNSGYGSDSDVISAIENATLRGSDVISMSLGSYADSDSAYKSVIDNAMDNGTLVVSAAGNSGPGAFTTDAPGTTLSGLTVGAICLTQQLGEQYCDDDDFPLATFSSRGFVFWSNGSFSGIKPDILAPGVRINSTDNDHANDYTIRSGTSMSTPHISGVVALIKQAHPTWTTYDIKASIVNYANDMNFTIYKQGTGLVNARRSYNTSIVIKQSDSTNMVYIGSNFNTSIIYQTFTNIFNITNKWNFTISTQIHVYNKTTSYFEHTQNPIILEPDESVLVHINTTLNSSALNGSDFVYNDTWIFSTNLSMNISVPYSFISILNPPSCPPIDSGHHLYEDYSLTTNCTLPDFQRQGAFRINVSDINFNCNGHTIDGFLLVPSSNIIGGRAIYAYESEIGYLSNISIRNCYFKNYLTPVLLIGLNGTPQTRNSVKDSIFTELERGITAKNVGYLDVINNTFFNLYDSSATSSAIYYYGSNSGRNIFANKEINISNNIIRAFPRFSFYTEYLTNTTINRNVVFNQTKSTTNVIGQLSYINHTTNLVFSNTDVYNSSYGYYCLYMNYTVRDSIINVTKATFLFGSEGGASPSYEQQDCHILFLNVTKNIPVTFLGTNKKSTFTNKNYLTVTVIDSESKPYDGAIVTVKNDNGTIEWVATTDTNGQILKKPTIDYWRNRTTTFNYTSINVEATDGENSSDTTISMDTNKLIQLQLGEPTPEVPIEAKTFGIYNGAIKLNQGRLILTK